MTCTSWRNAPTTSVIRIGPEQIAHGTFVWHLLKSVQCSNVIKRIDRWTKPTVQAEDLSIYQSRQRQCYQQSYGFYRIIATIDVIAHEQIVSVRRSSTYPKQLHQVVELSMNVSTYCNRAFYLLYVGLLR
uniref:Uncharacterized protein n=1 Tax=Anopheles melas TaxID=34690 RepID=A0A182TQU7_9DIPT